MFYKAMRITPVNLINYKYTAHQQDNRPAKTVRTKQNYPAAFMGYKPEYSEYVAKFWNSIKHQNGKIFQQDEKGIWKPILNEEVINNLKAGFNFLEQLPYFKNSFTEHFCRETGFPNLARVSDNIDSEILKNAHEFSDKLHAKLLFAAYDCNNSAGKRMALPGSDCDGLLFIYEDGAYNSSVARWGVLEDVNKRIICPHIDFPPELFKLSEMDSGLNIVNNAFHLLEKELTPQDFKTFSDNIKYQGKDFLKSADFNIRLTKYIPDRDKNLAAMTGYFAEYIRAGKVLENNLPSWLITKLKSSQFYKYSNILRQEAFKPLIKQKIKARENIVSDFNSMPSEDKYQLAKNIVLASFEQPVSERFQKYFKVDGNGKNINTEMGNLLEMYDKLF